MPANSLAASRACLWLAGRRPGARQAPRAGDLRMRIGARAGTSARPRQVAEIAAPLGIERAALLAAVADPAIKERLKQATAAAIARGVFGSPFVFVDGEAFWGADRLDSGRCLAARGAAGERGDGAMTEPCAHRAPRRTAAPGSRSTGRTIHNAFDDRLIAELTAALSALASDAAVRAVVLTGSGKSFSAGADLNWMRRTSTYGEAENLADARALAKLMATLDELPKPTIARVNGAALGGGTGLVACCDIAVASADASVRHDRGPPRPDPRRDRALRRRGDRRPPGAPADADRRADRRGRGGPARAGPRGRRGGPARWRGRGAARAAAARRAAGARGGQAPGRDLAGRPIDAGADRRHREPHRRAPGDAGSARGRGRLPRQAPPSWLA